MERNIWPSSIGICLMTFIVLMTFSSTNCFVRDNNLNDDNDVKFAEDRTIFGGEAAALFFGAENNEEPPVPDGMIPPLPVLLKKAAQFAFDLIVALSGLINDSYGIFILSNEFVSIINGTNNIKDKSGPVSPFNSAPTWWIRDDISNSTERLLNNMVLSNYFTDEKNIVEAYNQLVSLSQGSGRNLRKNKESFLQISSSVDRSLTHLLDGMLGTYNYGGDILRSTIDYVQCNPRRFRESTDILMSLINKGMLISSVSARITDSLINPSLSTQYHRVLKRAELLLNDCTRLRPDRIQDQMKRTMLKSTSVEDAAANIFDMLMDYYENVKWLVLVHQSEAQNQNRSVEDAFSVTLGSLTAFAYVLKGEFDWDVTKKIERFCNQTRFYWSTMGSWRRCGYPSEPRFLLWKSENISTIFSGLDAIIPNDYSFHVLGRKLPDQSQLSLVVKSSEGPDFYKKYFGYDGYNQPWLSNWNDGFTVLAFRTSANDTSNIGR